MHSYSGTVLLCKGIRQKSKSFYKITIEIDLMYYRISFGISDKNNIKHQ